MVQLSVGNACFSLGKAFRCWYIIITVPSLSSVSYFYFFCLENQSFRFLFIPSSITKLTVHICSPVSRYIIRPHRSAPQNYILLLLIGEVVHTFFGEKLLKVLICDALYIGLFKPHFVLMR